MCVCVFNGNSHNAHPQVCHRLGVKPEISVILYLIWKTSIPSQTHTNHKKTLKTGRCLSEFNLCSSSWTPFDGKLVGKPADVLCFYVAIWDFFQCKVHDKENVSLLLQTSQITVRSFVSRNDKRLQNTNYISQHWYFFEICTYNASILSKLAAEKILYSLCIGSLRVDFTVGSFCTFKKSSCYLRMK